MSQAVHAPRSRSDRVTVAGRAGAGWAGLPDALHAEWTKLRTLASTWWLLLAAAALTVVVGAAVAAAYRCSGGPVACEPAATGADPAKISLTGVYLRQVIVALLAVLAG